MNKPLFEPEPTPDDFPYQTLWFHCPVTCWTCYQGTCGHGVGEQA